jgi:hypothetical protein
LEVLINKSNQTTLFLLYVLLKVVPCSLFVSILAPEKALILSHESREFIIVKYFLKGEATSLDGSCLFYLMDYFETVPSLFGNSAPFCAFLFLFV